MTTPSYDNRVKHLLRALHVMLTAYHDSERTNFEDALFRVEAMLDTFDEEDEND